jgi:hypothetical protein
MTSETTDKSSAADASSTSAADDDADTGVGLGRDPEVDGDEEPIETWKLIAGVAAAFAVVAVIAIAVLALGGDGDESSDRLPGTSEIVDGFDREDAAELGSTESGETWEQVKGTFGLRGGQRSGMGPHLPLPGGAQLLVSRGIARLRDLQRQEDRRG